MSKPTNFSSTAFLTVTNPLTPQQQPPTALSRRQFLTALGATLAGGALAYANQGQANARARSAITHISGQVERPNIILIITNQERYPRHWPDGWVEANLPARQRLAQNGLSFRRSFCSTAMCSPSRSTLFTGLHPAQHGVVHTLTEGGSASPIEPTLPTAIHLDAALSDLAIAHSATADSLYTFIYHRAWEHLDELERTVLLALPMVSDDGGTLSYLATITEILEGNLHRALDHLVTLNLVESRGGLHKRRYAVHNLTRTFLHRQVTKWS